MNKSNPPSGNAERIRCFDLARGVSLVLMVAIHVLEQLSSKELEESLFGQALNTIITPLAAPVFMFLMGIFLGLSAHTGLAKSAKRGLSLMLIGYLLNFLRGTLPVWMGLLGGDISSTGITAVEALEHVTEVDILQLAGLALITLPWIRRVFPWKYSWLALAGAVLFAAPFLKGITSGQPAADFFLALLWGEEEGVYFPLFPWLFFPLAGMAYGALYTKVENKTSFFALHAAAGASLALAAAVLILNASPSLWGDWAKGMFLQGCQPPMVMILLYGCLLVWLSLCWLTVKFIPSNAAFRRLYFWSENVLLYYCLQWIIIGWLVIVLSPLQLLGTILFTAGTVFLTHLLIVYLKPYWQRIYG